MLKFNKHRGAKRYKSTLEGKPTKRGISMVKEAAEEMGIDINEPFDLFKITSCLEKHHYDYILEQSRIDTTLKVLEAINILKEGNQNVI